MLANGRFGSFNIEEIFCGSREQKIRGAVHAPTVPPNVSTVVRVLINFLSKGPEKIIVSERDVSKQFPGSRNMRSETLSKDLRVT